MIITWMRMKQMSQMFYFEMRIRQRHNHAARIPKNVPGEDVECAGKSSGSTTPKDMASSGVMVGQMYSSIIQESWVRDTEH